MSPLRVVIIDDEEPARSRMRELLEDCRPEFPHSVVGEAANGVDGLRTVTESAAEVVLVELVRGAEATREEAASERRVGHEADAELPTGWQHLVLGVA